MTNYLITVPIYQSKAGEIGNVLIDHNKILHSRLYNHRSRQCIYVIIMNYLFNKLDIKVITVTPYNYQLLHVKHGIKSSSTILTKYLTNLSKMWPKSLSLAIFAYNTFNTPNLANFRAYRLVFGRKPMVVLKNHT